MSSTIGGMVLLCVLLGSCSPQERLVVYTDPIWWKAVGPDLDQPLRTAARGAGLSVSIVVAPQVTSLPRGTRAVVLSPLLASADAPEIQPNVLLMTMGSGRTDQQTTRLVSDRSKAFQEAGQAVVRIVSGSSQIGGSGVAVLAPRANASQEGVAFATGYREDSAGLTNVPPLILHDLGGNVTRNSARETILALLKEDVRVFVVLAGDQSAWLLDAIERERAFAIVEDLGSTGAYPRSVLFSIEEDLVAAVGLALLRREDPLSSVVIPAFVLSRPALQEVVGEVEF